MYTGQTIPLQKLSQLTFKSFKGTVFYGQRTYTNKLFAVLIKSELSGREVYIYHVVG